MKKIISLKKELTFPSMIGEVTSISLDHTLKFIDSSNISGDLKLTGTYKLTEASRLEENFDFNIPVEIDLTEKLDLSTTKIDIDDFYYELENEDTMICYADVKIEGVEIIDILEESVQENNPQPKPVERIEPVSKEEDLTPVLSDAKDLKDPENTRECDCDIINSKEEPIPAKEEEPKKEVVNSLFSNLKDSEDTFSTYSVYILREEETIQNLIEKYHVTKEELENYNDLANLTVGSKIIIPNTQNEPQQ